jgi:hypothetical protein
LAANFEARGWVMSEHGAQIAKQQIAWFEHWKKQVFVERKHQVDLNAPE